MNRRHFLGTVSIAALAGDSIATLGTETPAAAGGSAPSFRNSTTGRAWRTEWETNLTATARTRYCDQELGEELGWRVSPVLNGCYYGYLATRDPKWVDLLVDWADSCIRRGVVEPDGFTGWPKGDGGGGSSDEFSADSLLGEAMLLRPLVLMADLIRRTPALNARHGARALAYLELAGKTFEKWDSRDCWREVGGGGVWVVAAWGIDPKTGTWSAGYADRKTTGFTNPDNKQNHIARWLLAMHDVFGKPVYRDRAEQWFRVMRSRMERRDGGKYFVWNYWAPAGPWDFRPNGAPKHWVGVHPNGGYYEIDAEAIVDAFEHGLVFSREEMDRLIATNRDFMWNQKIEPARFQRIDGGTPDPRWENSPGVLWKALVFHDDILRRVFVANHKPGSWGGLGSTPWFLSGGDAAARKENRQPGQ